MDTTNAQGNFYLKPNGVFYLTTENVPEICTTEMFHNNGKVAYATQSGPMLVIENQIHPAFKEGSPNLNIRNGVGILPNGKMVFVLSKKEVNFYDFAKYFKDLGCKNALYLDGFVSRAYLPSENWIQTDGNFGVLFAVTTKK
ncbi:MAG: phosphodiester glycosidase family protein [Flavobacterium sp.]